jgi:type II secretory pathway component PulK
MQKITSIISNQQGSVIVIAMFILVLLTVIGIAASNTSTTEMQITTNALLYNTAFYTAESGIEAGRAVLNNIKIEDAGSWDILLFNNGLAEEDQVSIKVGGEDCKPDPCRTLNDIIDQIEPGGRMVGPATFTLTIQDNDDLDGNDTVDSDNTVLLTSTLAAPYRNATATISTSVHGGGEAYAQEHYNAGSTGEAAMESETASAHVRW